MPFELRHQISQLADSKFWLQLCDGFSLTEETPLADLSSGDSRKFDRDDNWHVCKELIAEEGYFVYHEWFDTDFVDRLAGGILKLRDEGIPPVFCFVYDEYWNLLQQLHPLFEDLVGEYWLLPAVWAWHVTYDNQSAFTPHRDQLRDVAPEEEEHLDYLTVWIPLTDLDHLNSSISILPASCDPDYDGETEAIRVENLQSIRSLQAKRGAMMCWTTGLAHWGTSQTKYGNERISVGLYLQNPEVECFDPPPMDFSRPFPLAERLTLIANQIVNYARTDDLLEYAKVILAE